MFNKHIEEIHSLQHQINDMQERIDILEKKHKDQYCEDKPNQSIKYVESPYSIYDTYKPLLSLWVEQSATIKHMFKQLSKCAFSPNRASNALISMIKMERDKLNQETV